MPLPCIPKRHASSSAPVATASFFLQYGTPVSFLNPHKVICLECKACYRQIETFSPGSSVDAAQTRSRFCSRHWCDAAAPQADHRVG
jgi:hypothetical protein